MCISCRLKHNKTAHQVVFLEWFPVHPEMKEREEKERGGGNGGYFTYSNNTNTTKKIMYP